MLVSPQAFGGISGNVDVMTSKTNFCFCAEHLLFPVMWGKKNEFLPLLSPLLAPKTRQILVPPLGHLTPMHRGPISCVFYPVAPSQMTLISKGMTWTCWGMFKHEDDQRDGTPLHQAEGAGVC